MHHAGSRSGTNLEKNPPPMPLKIGSPQLIYKIVGDDDWRLAQERGRYDGSRDDLRDGFIHFSSAEQVAGTAAKHFRARADLLLVAVRADAVNADLKWEPSRNGELFPHLYAPLNLDAVAWTTPLPVGRDGVHVLPERLA
jgi:uncharacterized protein (DUF952 family)